MLKKTPFVAFYVERSKLYAGSPPNGFQEIADGISYAHPATDGLIAAYREDRLEGRREVIFFSTAFGVQKAASAPLSAEDVVINSDYSVYVLRKKPMRLERLENGIADWEFVQVPFEWSGAELPYGIIATPQDETLGAWRVDRVEIKTPWARLTLDGAGYARYIDGSVLVEAEDKTTIIPTFKTHSHDHTTRVRSWKFVCELKNDDWLVYDAQNGVVKQVAPHTGTTRRGGVHKVGRKAFFQRETPVVIAEDGYAYDYSDGVAQKRRLLRVPLSYSCKVFYDNRARGWDVAYVKGETLYTMRRGEVWRAPEGRKIGSWCIREYGGFFAIAHHAPKFEVKNMCLTAESDTTYELVTL